MFTNIILLNYISNDIIKICFLGSVLTQVKLATNMPVNYQLIGDEGIFIIDSDGQIILTSNLDRETNALHHLGVIALSDSSPPLSSVTEILLHVLDSNDNTPQFDSKMYAIHLAENVLEGTSVIRGKYKLTQYLLNLSKLSSC